MSQPDTLEEAVRAFLRKKKNPGTRRAYAQVLEPFARDFGPRRPLDTITTQDIDAWDDMLTARSLAAATVTSHYKRMKAFWNWCVERELADISPARFLKIRKRRVNLASKALPVNIRTAMLDAVQRKPARLPRLRDTAILALIATYGARGIDVQRLTLPRINFAQEWIVWHTKGDHEDRRPLPPDTAAHLRTWIDFRQTLHPDPAHNFVFVNIRTAPGQRYQPLKAGSIQTMFKRLALRVCGQMHGPHSARHLRAQELLDAGFPAELVMEILGHQSRETLANYANQDWDRQKRALAATDMGRNPNAPSEALPGKGKVVDVDPSIFRHSV